MLIASSRSSLCFMYHYGLGLDSFSFHCYNICYSFHPCLFTIFDFHSQFWIQYHLLFFFWGSSFLCLFCHKSILVKMESLSFQSLGCFWFLICCFCCYCIILHNLISIPYLFCFFNSKFFFFYFLNFVSHFSFFRFFSLIFLCSSHSCL